MRSFSRRTSRAISLILAMVLTMSLLPALPAVALTGTVSVKPAESNIALKYWATATASSNSENAWLAIDGNLDTAWTTASAEASLTVDLSGTYDALYKTEIVFAGENSAYKYKLEGSTDGVAWFILADRTGNTKVASGFTDLFKKTGIRFLRVTITGGNPVGVKELRIINYLRPDMNNGSDIGALVSGTIYYNTNNSPVQMLPDGSRAYRGGTGNAASITTGNNYYGLTKDMGWDTIRLRIWNLPRSEGTSSKTAALGTIPAGSATGSCSPSTVRTHANYIVGAGQNLAIDFHYADSWADPQNQPKPYEWAELPFESENPETNDLIKTTYNFTYDMIKSLIDQGTAPSIVALGNEITNGMMWGREYELTNPYCDYHDYYRRYIRDNPNAPYGGGIEWVNYEAAKGDKNSPEYKSFLASVLRLSKLVDAGQRAIKKLNAEYGLKIQTEMHFAFNVFEGSPKVAHDPDEVFEKNVALVCGLADHLKTMSGMTDRIGISYYPDWHGTYAIVQKNIVELARLLPEGVKFNISECNANNSGTVSGTTGWMTDPNVVVGPWNPNLPSSFTRTTQSAADHLVSLLKLINDVPNNIGMGVWPWNGQSIFGSSGTLRADFLAFALSHATGVVESGVYASTVEGVAPVLPATVKELKVADGTISDVAVSWSTVEAASYAKAGTFTVTGTATAAGNMNEVTAYVTVVDAPAQPTAVTINPADIKILNKTADGMTKALVEFDLSTESGFAEGDLGKIKPSGFRSDVYQGTTEGSTWILQNRPDGTGKPAKLSAWAVAEFADANVCCVGSSTVLESCPGKPVTITGITLGGTERGKYTLAQTTATGRAHITERVTRVENNQYGYAPVMNLRQDFMMAVDMSSEPALRASTASPHSTNNFVFRNKAGEPEDIYKIYADHGITHVRCRVWVDPYYRGETLRPPTSGSLSAADYYVPNHPLYGDGYGPGTYGGGNCNIDTALEMGLRVTQYGMKLNVNFHYSDTWTDPGRNYAPKAWNDMNMTQKRQALYDYTYESLEKLVRNGVDVDIVQCGNETQGRLSGETSAANFYLLVKSGCDAIDAINEKYGVNIKKCCHFANPSSDATSIRTWVNGVFNAGANLDLVLLSWYPEYTSHGTLANLLNLMNNLVADHPNMEVGVGETDNRMQGSTFTNQATLFPDYNPNPQGQAKEMYDVISQVAKVNGGKGAGVFYWEPAWATPIDATSRRYYGTGWASRYSSYYDGNNNSASSDGSVGSSQNNKNTFATTENARTPLPVMDVWSLVYGGGGRAPESPVIVEPDPNTIADKVSRINFNEGWQFLLATRTPTDASPSFAAAGFADPAGQPTTAQIIDPLFDDSAWRTVKVPHDFSIEGQKVSSGSSGSQDYLQGGLGWYRKSFILPESMKDVKRIQLDFEGVYQNSNVYVNGQLVGNYPSGYTGFTYDITEYLKYGENNPNVVVVKVQNKSPSGRWYTGSGITRPVTLVVSGQTRYLRNGVVITMPTVEADYKADKSAEIKVRADIRSDDVNSNIWLVNKVYDADGVLKAEHTSELQPMNPSSFISLNDAFKVSDIKLWTLTDPYRYTVVTELYYLRDGSQEPAVLVDSVSNKIGFRWFRIDNNQGAYLNDVYFKFQGVDLHHDDGALGAAGTYDAVKRKMEILQTMGVNSYRTSHNPPNKAIIDVCSELGIVVMEEAYDGWGGAKGGSDFGLFWWTNVLDGWKGSLKPIPENTTWSEWVIKEMVARDINEPSVVMWSIGNEVGGLGTRPSWYNWADFRRTGDPNPSGYTSTTLNMFTEAMRLRNYCKDVDPTRYVVMGDDSLRTPPTTTSEWGYVSLALDGVGVNYNTATSVDDLHDRFPGQFWFESESSSQTGTRGVYYDAPMQNTPADQTPGSRGVSSYDNQFSSWTMPNEYGLKKDRDRLFFLGQFIWSGFDYLGEPTPYGIYPMGHSNFGTIDTAGFPKDSYYLFRSQWVKNGHTTHLVPMNWSDWAVGENVEVWVNTDGYSAELFLNGESLGVKSFNEKETTFGLKYYETTEQTKDNGGSGYGLTRETSTNNPNGYVSPNGSYGKLHLTWDVPFTPGELKTVVKDKAGNIIGEDTIKTAGHAYTTRVTPYKSVVKADGNSLVYFTVEVVDQNGTMLPSGKNLLQLSVENGMIIGVDSGWPGITDLYKYGNLDRSPVSQLHAWNGKALVIVESTKNPGLITLRTTSEDLVPTTCSVLATQDGNGAYTSVTVLESLGAAQSARLYYGNSITVPLGSVAALPVDAEVTYASGAKVLKKVTWPAINDSQFKMEGSFNVTGTVADTSLTVTANVTVANAAKTNIALNTSAGTQDFVLTPTSGPLATATFTAGTNYPNLMLNGNTTTNWNNRGNGSATVVLRAVTYSKPYEFVQVYWYGYKPISEVDLYFTTGSSGPSNNLPGQMIVQYWDGFKWTNASNQKTVLATASNAASTVTFDTVVTSKVRVFLKNATPYSATTGCFTIVKLEVYNIAEEVEPPAIVSLADVTVRTVAGTAPQLPSMITATYDNGGTGEVLVAWDEISAASYAKEGTFNVAGTVAGTDIKAKAVVTVDPKPAEPPPNLFTNGSFEDGTTPWLLRNATTGATTALPTVTGSNFYRRNDSQNVHGTGTYAVNYSVTGAFSGYSEMYQNITVGDAPGIYTLSAWAQGSSTGSGILEIFAEAGGEIYTQAFTATGWRNWANPTITGITITDTARVGVRITYGNGSWYWLDEFSLLKTADLPVQDEFNVAERNIDFNDGWKFYLATRTPTVASGSGASGYRDYGLADAGDYTTAQIIAPTFDDSDWRTVNVPHDYAIEGQKVSSSGTAQGYMQAGLGWYRKTFSLPEEMRNNKKIAIDFDGVYQNPIVYLNGELVGNYPSGYSSFAFDITSKLKFGNEGPNVLVVKVQNISSSGRWYTGSGIIRPVTLVVTNNTRILRNGLTLTTPDLAATYKADGSAVLNVSAKVYSDDINGVVQVRTTVKDGDQVVATKTSDIADSNPTTTITLTDSITIPKVKLWSMENPFRYDVVTEILYTPNAGGGPKVTDGAVTKFGFRYFEFSPTKGFFLNGEYKKLQGVDLHHDQGALGAAANYDALKRELMILQSMGVNSYRTSHCPPSKTVIDLCSELGIVVMEEAYDSWGSPKQTYDFGIFFLQSVPANYPGQLNAQLPANAVWSDWIIKEMVLRDINEPSVIMWSIGNEISSAGTRPSWYNWEIYYRADKDHYTKPSSYTSTTFNLHTETMRLRNDILDVDSTRPVVCGTDQERTPPSTTATWGYINNSLDGVGLNYNTASSVDTLMTNFPNVFFFESESSSQTGARGVYFSPSLPNTPPNQTPGTRGTSAYDNNFASWTIPNEYGLKKDRDRLGFAGQFIWSGFDYIGEPTPYGVYPVGVSFFGTIDTAGFPKDSYYLFRSQWTKEPMAHIVPMNWTDWRPGEIVEVWVNTNAVKAELFLNGKSLGIRSFDEKTTAFGVNYYETTERTQDLRTNTGSINTGGYVSPNDSYGKLHLTWYVPFEPGELKVIAMDKDNNPVAADTRSTAGQAYTISMKPDKEYLQPDGRSLVYVECDIVDEKGEMLPSANTLVKFDIEGNAKIFGVDNGKQESNELYKWGNLDKNTHSERESYNGKVLVIVISEKGSGGFKLTASSDNLVPTVLNMATEPGIPLTITNPAIGTVDAVEIKSINAVVGKPAVLPRNINVIYSSGLTLIKKVTWEAVDPAKYNTFGSFTVSGVFEDKAITATAVITVNVKWPGERVNYGLNTTAGTQDYKLSGAGPLATATFTSGTSYPNYMLNGNTTSYWDNYAQAGQTTVLAAITASRAYDFVETYWPDVVTVDRIGLFFTTNANYNLPASLNVQYWDGLSWVDAGNQVVTFATASNDETRITFDTVATTRVRVGMENATPLNSTTGRMRIVKFETWGFEYLDANRKAALIEAIAGAPTDEGKYTNVSWAALQAALETAVAVVNNIDATKGEIDGALDVLLAALDGLRIKITSMRINAAASIAVTRGGKYSFGLTLNEGALPENVIWSVNNPLYATVDNAGNVTILNKAGTVVLLATDPDSGLSFSIILRIT